MTSLFHFANRRIDRTRPHCLFPDPMFPRFPPIKVVPPILAGEERSAPFDHQFLHAMVAPPTPSECNRNNDMGYIERLVHNAVNLQMEWTPGSAYRGYVDTTSKEEVDVAWAFSAFVFNWSAWKDHLSRHVGGSVLLASTNCNCRYCKVAIPGGRLFECLDESVIYDSLGSCPHTSLVLNKAYDTVLLSDMYEALRFDPSCWVSLLTLSGSSGGPLMRWSLRTIRATGRYFENDVVNSWTRTPMEDYTEPNAFSFSDGAISLDDGEGDSDYDDAGVVDAGVVVIDLTKSDGEEEELEASADEEELDEEYFVPVTEYEMRANLEDVVESVQRRAPMEYNRIRDGKWLPPHPLDYEIFEIDDEVEPRRRSGLEDEHRRMVDFDSDFIGTRKRLRLEAEVRGLDNY